MKFFWKFKQLLKNKYLKFFYKIWKHSKIVDNLLINRKYLVKNEKNNVNYWYLRIIDNPLIINRNE